MKRPLLFSSVLCLVIGLLCGLLLPAPWDQDKKPVTPPAITAPNNTPSAPSDPGAPTPPKKPLPPLNPEDNYALLNTAYLVAGALEARDYTALSSMVHPEKGVSFTPFSTVDPETDVNLTASAVKSLDTDDNIYTWGFEDGRGNLIELTAADYFVQYVYNADYISAPQIGVDQVLISGNALENVKEAYPGCRFVDFCIPSQDPDMEGMDWTSLKLVFEPGETRWFLVGVIHGQWTI